MRVDTRRFAVGVGLALTALVGVAFFIRGCPSQSREPAPHERPRLEREFPPDPPSPTPPAPPAAVHPLIVPAQPPVAAPAAPTIEEPPEEEPPMGAIEGTVRLLGKAPPAQFVDLRAEPLCAAKYPNGLPAEDLVVDAKNNLAWSVVYLQSDPKPWRPKRLAHLPSILTISGCRIISHVVGVIRDEPLKLVNEDEITHLLTYSMSDGQRGWTTTLGGGRSSSIRFSPRHTIQRYVCDLHPWEIGWVAAMEHPYFAITDPQGHYKIPRVPAGTYLLFAWHERCVRDFMGVANQTVLVQEGETTTAGFELKLTRP